MKKIKNMLSQIFKNIFLYKKRTVLSILGILIATIVINVALINVNYSTYDNLQNYIDYPVNTGVYYAGYDEDPSFPEVDMECLYEYSGTIENSLIPSSEVSVSLYGCSENFLNYPVFNSSDRRFLSYTELLYGNELTSKDILEGKNYIYLESGFADCLFDGNPLGREINVDGTEFTVNGILKTSSSTLRYLDSLKSGDTLNVIAFAPYTALYQAYDSRSIFKTYLFKYHTGTDLDALFSANGYYSYDKAMETIEEKRSTTFSKLLTIFVSSILCMGTLEIIIIVFNLKERVYEIGIKRALGATKDDICFEFMLEIIILGIIALFLGILVSYNLNVIMSLLFYKSNYVYASFLSAREVMQTSAYILLMVGISSLIPMVYTSNLNIIDVIKGE